MTRSWSAIVICLMFSCAVCLGADTPAKDVPKEMILNTPAGDELRLNPDNTWVPVASTEVLIEKDFTVPITDGRIILINTDGTWGFVTEELQYAEDLISVTKVVGSGTGSSLDVTAATNAAQEKALNSAIAKTRDALRKIKKVDPKKVPDCVKRVEKDVDKKEQFAKGKGWTVMVQITLDKGSLLAVADCATKQEEPAPE